MTLATAGPLVVGPATLPGLMDAAVERIGWREAYVEVATGQRLTFGQWVRAADAVAAHLAGLGVGPGDVVAVSLPPSIDYAIACAAGLRLGAVVTGINSRLGPREVSAILARCRPRAVIRPDEAISPAGVASELRRSDLADLADLAGRAASDPDPAHAPGPAGDPDPPRHRRAAPAIRPEDPAVIIWTSGTTGQPKGAWFDHHNLAAAVETAGAMTAPLDRRISGIPMAHAGYMAKIWEQLAFGVTLVLTPTPWTAASMLRVLVDERITVGAGVPTQWAKLLELPGIAAADLSALRICLAATAPAPPELVARMRQVLGCPVIVRYAMTESPSITGTGPDDRPEVVYRTVGRPQSGVRVEIVGDDGTPVAPGRVGRVRISGPCVMRGYWDDAAATAEVLDDAGRLLSSDLGRIDGTGHLVMAGRVSEMYIRGGYNVYPLEVEHVLAEHPDVAAVAVVGVPRPVIGEIGVAFVVAAPGARPDRDSLRAWVSDRLADYKAPDEVRIVDALPLTAMQKVDKAALGASLRAVPAAGAPA